MSGSPKGSSCHTESLPKHLLLPLPDTAARVPFHTSRLVPLPSVPCPFYFSKTYASFKTHFGFPSYIQPFLNSFIHLPLRTVVPSLLLAQA